MRDYPVILGMSSPTKVVVCGESCIFPQKRDLIVYHASFPEGSTNPKEAELTGMAAWLHFCTPEAMRRLVAMARKAVACCLQSATSLKHLSLRSKVSGALKATKTAIDLIEAENP